MQQGQAEQFTEAETVKWRSSEIDWTDESGMMTMVDGRMRPNLRSVVPALDARKADGASKTALRIPRPPSFTGSDA